MDSLMVKQSAAMADATTGIANIRIIITTGICIITS